MNAEALGPNGSTGFRGCTVSGVSTPISRTLVDVPSYSTLMVSPSTTLSTGYSTLPTKDGAGWSALLSRHSQQEGEQNPNRKQSDFRVRDFHSYEIGESSNVNGGGGSGILISERWGLLPRVDKQRIRTTKTLARACADGRRK